MIVSIFEKNSNIWRFNYLLRSSLLTIKRSLNICSMEAMTPATYVRAADVKTFFAPSISLDANKWYSSSLFNALLEASNSTGRVTSWNIKPQQVKPIPK